MSLTTLANVKAFKNIAGTEHDAELARLIPMADALIARYCGRTFEAASVTEYHSTRAAIPRLALARPPVTAITSIHDDPDRQYGSGTLLTPGTDYVLEDPEAGIVAFDQYTVLGGINNLKVVYDGGYATIPADLEQAAIEIVWLTRDLGDQALLGILSKSIADGSVTAFQRDRIDGVRTILDAYRLRRVV